MGAHSNVGFGLDEDTVVFDSSQHPGTGLTPAPTRATILWLLHHLVSAHHNGVGIREVILSVLENPRLWSRWLEFPIVEGPPLL